MQAAWTVPAIYVPSPRMTHRNSPGVQCSAESDGVISLNPATSISITAPGLYLTMATPKLPENMADDRGSFLATLYTCFHPSGAEYLFRPGIYCKYAFAANSTYRYPLLINIGSDGGRLSYRMAEVALNQQAASLAADFRYKGINVALVAVHPGRVPARMSGWWYDQDCGGSKRANIWTVLSSMVVNSSGRSLK
jgi:hypothetical protein